MIKLCSKFKVELFHFRVSMLGKLVLSAILSAALGPWAHSATSAGDDVASEIGSLRVRALKAAETGQASTLYMSAKAQAWLDFAFEEYIERDNTGVTEDALSRARQLVGWLEQHEDEGKPEPENVRSVMRVRVDLWTILAGFQSGSPGYTCAAPYLGRAEVQLVWAGHELPELGDLHAKPAIDETVRLIKAADQAAKDCDAQTEKPLIDAKPDLGATVSQVAIQQAVARLPDSVHFAYNRSDIDPASDLVLRDLADTLKAYPWLSLNLVGHTDPIGGQRYNLQLSRQRADRVKSRLIELGLAGERFTTRGLGKTQLLMLPDGTDARARDRRVGFVISNPVDGGGEALSIETLVQEADLKPGGGGRVPQSSRKRSKRGAGHD